MQWRVAAWTHPADPNGFGPREHSIPFVRYQGNDPEEPRGRCTITVPETYDWRNLIAVQDPSNAADTSLIRLYRAGQDNSQPPDVEYLLQRFQKVIAEDGTATVELYGVDWRLAALDTTVVRWWDWEPGATVSQQKDWEYGGPNVLGDGFENVGSAPDVWDLHIQATGGTFDLGPAGDLQTLDFDTSDTAMETALQSTTEITDANVEKEADVETTWTLTIDATGGTFNIGDSTDDADLAHDVSEGDLETALEAFASITGVTVFDEGGGVYTIELDEPTGGVDLTVDGANLTGGAGTADIEYDTFGNAYRITMVQPSFGVDLELDAAALTGADVLATLRRAEADQLETGSWTKAQQVSQGSPFVYGGYDFFGVSDEQAHTGSNSLKVDPQDIDTAGRFPGAQVIANVTPGTLYQARIWVYTTSSTDKYRFVLRTLWGDELFLLDGSVATDTGALGGTSFTAGQWHEVTISDIVIPPGVDQIIYRFSNVDATGNPSAFYLDDPYLARGLPSDTIGKISQDLMADAKTDHAPTLERLPYLTEGAYTDADDETAEAWVRDESITLRRGKKYGTHIYGGQFRDLGYEYDVVPGDGTGGDTDPDEANWYLRLYNPGNHGTVLEGTAFVVGLGVNGGLIAGRLPRATRWLAEGKGGIITEVVDTAQEAATGIVEGYIGDDDITDTVSLAARAQHELDADLANKLALTAELDDSGPVAYRDFNRGDTARFLYAGTAVAHTRRISEISMDAAAGDNGEIAWNVSVTASRLFRGDQALKEAVYRLLTEYDRLPEEAEEGPVNVIAGGGGVPRITMAAADASERSKSKADPGYVATGNTSDDAEMFGRAADEMDGLGGELRLTEGTLDLGNNNFELPENTFITGAGQGASELDSGDMEWTDGGGARFLSEPAGACT